MAPTATEPRDRMSHYVSDGEGLSPGQLLALAAIMAGESLTEAAAAAGVDRRTIYRWLNEDADFRAAYNRGRRELRREVENHLLRVARMAVETVQRAVTDGNVIASLAVLRGTGLLSGAAPAIGSEDADELREQDRRDRERADLMRALS
jgi:hypothetical protein